MVKIYYLILFIVFKKEDLKLFTMFFRKLEARCSNLIKIL